MPRPRHTRAVPNAKPACDQHRFARRESGGSAVQVHMRSQHVLGGRSTSHGVRNATGPPARFSLVQVSHLNIRMVARLAVLACIMASSSAFAPSVSNLALRSASSCRLHSCAPSRAVRLGRLRMQQQVHSSLHLAMRSDSCKRSSPLLAGPSEQSCTQLLRRSV
jgi:hypothetical protein